MLSRFLLDLREVAYGSNILSTPSTSRDIESQSLSFTQMIGSLGNAVGDSISGLADEEDADEGALRTGEDSTAQGVGIDIEIEAGSQT